MGTYTKKGLSAGQRFAVWQIVQQEYTQADMPDRAFAEMLTGRLGHEISDHTISEARKHFNIPSWRDRNVAVTPDGLLQRVAQLEMRVEAVERRTAGVAEAIDKVIGVLRLFHDPRVKLAVESYFGKE